MKFYLSSYKFGNELEKFREFAKSNNKLGYIPNALDFSGADLQRKEQGIQKEMSELKDFGFQVELIDLKTYFGQKDKLERKLKKINGLFVRGGNSFILRQAMKLSGLDILLNKIKDNKEDFLYSGYSAGACVLAPNLKALKTIDDSTDMPYEGIEKVVFDGLKILDYIILPHYKSNHPESSKIDKGIEYCKKNNILFKPLRDGEVIVIE